jgi:hypothetical protein
MSKPEPRSFSTVREIEFQLKPFMQTEAVEILARVMARIIAHDPRQFTQLTELFKHAFSQEHEYLNSRQKAGGPDPYHRSGVS